LNTSKLSAKQSFTRGSEDKLSGLGLGKLALIKGWLEKYDIKHYLLNDDDSIDVDGSVNLNKAGLTEIPDYIQFRRINGSFFIGSNELKSCKGFPINVKNSFDMEANGIFTLKYAPEYVGISIWCKNNHYSDEEYKEYLNKMEKNIPKNSAIWDSENKLGWHFDKIDESFVKGENKLKNLNIGKSIIIKKWLDSLNITNYQINNDNSIDVDGNCYLQNENLDSLPDFIKFHKINGDFDIHNNNLSSLRGCPDIINGYFDCTDNDLLSLKYAPDVIGSNIRISFGNSISYSESYDYILRMKEQRMNESFVKGENKLTNLGLGRKGLIKTWLEKYDIEKYTINDDLTIDVGKSVDLSSKGLEEIPEYIQFNIIKNFFDINDNKLISLRGCPNQVFGFFDCRWNKLTSLKYSPEYIKGALYIVPNVLIPNEEIEDYKMKISEFNKKYMD